MAYDLRSEIQGIGSVSFGVLAGAGFVKGTLSLPTIVGGAGASSVLVTVNQNGSPIYTGLVGAEGFNVNFLAALNDIIQVVTSSSATVDNALNTVKMQVQIGQGQ
jgi:hypothetical protein